MAHPHDWSFVGIFGETSDVDRAMQYVFEDYEPGIRILPPQAATAHKCPHCQYMPRESSSTAEGLTHEQVGVAPTTNWYSEQRVIQIHRTSST
jgi:hypothetical protein